MNRIDYYFWINSDWAYLGADRLEALAARYDVGIRYKPVDLLDVYARTGGIPLGQRSPERQAYRQAELKRWIRRLGIPLNITPRHMCPNGDLASRFTIAADQLGLNVAALYKAILAAEWCHEQDIADADVLLAVAAALDLPGERIMQAALTDKANALYRQYTDEAVAQGVFGSPTYVFNGELYWGQDRLEFLEASVAQAQAATTH
ncbi:2-hydroxychromene-2-carboxylate isomerase [Pusillimonas sp. SM2304]|uniref:2-hydroxychromene-2-carboxylate isomerase n=1 Tax=Pusillimonas sp. SM2304 TaxID=3073241 RepID=UPI002876DBD1|nr:2-hydroxychromene-2-carboxylate isomerase [Pusillimonas sp. SM2304]MDS1140088.1 2-hydroxychromene-2-carboxylate isomerase [Pusillimonas sp. SM2304]